MKCAIFPLSADSAAGLAAAVVSARSGARVRWSASDTFRLVIVYSGPADLAEKLRQAELLLANGLDQPERPGPQGIFYSCSPSAETSVTFLYPGQGSQRVGMLAGLRRALPGFDDQLERLNRIWQQIAGSSLLEAIYAHPSETTEARLRDTRLAQPALGLVSTALRLSLENLGLGALNHAGHSYGELSALCGAGYLDEKEFLTLSYERGRLLGEAGDTNPGAMLAFNAEREMVLRLCRTFDGTLELANFNSPQQCVIAGNVAAIEQLERAAAAAKMSAKRLHTSCAFHSSLMAPVASRWRQVLRRVLAGAGRKGKAVAFSNVTAQPYNGSGDVPELLAQQVVMPVRWADTCSALLQKESSIFVEVGPGQVLSDLMLKNLPSGASAPLVLCTDPRAEDAHDHVVNVFAKLASRGVEVKLESFAAPASLPADLRTSAPVTGLAGSLFESSRVMVDRYFAQQTGLVETALQHCSEPERKALVQSALTANENIMKEFLASQEATLRLLLGTSSATERSTEPVPCALETAPSRSRLGTEPRELASGRLETAPVGGDTRRDLASGPESVLRSEISRVTGFPPEAITPETSFNDLGLDSLSMIDIWTKVLERMPELRSLADHVLEVRCLADVSRLFREGVTQGSVVESEPAKIENIPPPVDWRAALIGAIAEKSGLAPAHVTPEADFEDDLGLDVFARELMFERIFSFEPRFREAGRELLNMRNIAELELLLDRFRPAATPPSPPERNVGEAVQRFVLRDEPVVSVPDERPQLPARVLLVGQPLSDVLVRLRRLLEASGTEVAVLSAAKEGWSIKGRSLPLESAGDLRRALAQTLEQRSHAVVFVAEPGHAEDESLERATTSLFTLAQSLQNNNGLALATQLTVLGCGTGDPNLEGVRGLARSLGCEEPELHVRSVWVRSSIDTLDDNMLLQAVFSSSLADDIEAADNQLVRRALQSAPQSTVPGTDGQMARVPRLHRSSRILVLGGGDGISAEIGIALAAAYECEIVAVGRTPMSDSFPFADIPFGPEADAQVKRRLFEAMSGTREVSGETLQRKWRRIARQRAIWNTKERVEASGGRFAYFSADVSDPAAFRRALESIRSRGPIHGIINGAGIIRDNLLARKTREEFTEVFRTKAVSSAVLYECLAAEPLEFVFFLSSLTSFTGTAGQTDYAAGNQVVNAIASDWNTHAAYPVKSLLWSVWSDAGLAGASLKGHMARLGLAGISTSDGLELMLNELRHGRKSEDWVLFAPMSTLRYCMQARLASAVPELSVEAKAAGRTRVSAVLSEPARR